ncbi:hypothetical protein DPEC_G00101990 [Dallia pectoralis]|uniref:Uncharacterized protein n=1 Tax=Dallia pectoralis TaxID=75939 RepID=A0ACC2GXM3_DALPE|nr:hypothetical protein DPEC_G00101990 [Dallia pectoralis]
MTMENASRLQSQLTTLMNAVVRAAVVEIVRLVENNSVALRRELSNSNLENEALKDQNESIKRKLQRLESKLSMSIAAKSLPVGLRQAAEAGGRKDNFDHTMADGKKIAGITSHESAVQFQQATHEDEREALRVVAIEKDEIQFICIKKEMNDVAEHEKPFPKTNAQLCPKVDMVYGKEWSQSLWRDGQDERGESHDRTEKEETPGTSTTQHQNGSLLHCSKLNPFTPILKVFCDPEQDTYSDYRLEGISELPVVLVPDRL